MALDLIGKRCSFSSFCWNSLLCGLQSILLCQVPAVRLLASPGAENQDVPSKLKPKSMVLSNTAQCLAGAVTQILPIRDRSLCEKNLLKVSLTSTGQPVLSAAYAASISLAPKPNQSLSQAKITMSISKPSLHVNLFNCTHFIFIFFLWLSQQSCLWGAHNLLIIC